ncbi:MAG: hypothetical protein J1F32_01780 [Erysipelotrichales bacterium]|nr:hypothetical protein [Erysipelotrichales bacterium]
MNKRIIRARIDLLILMHNFITQIDDEELYGYWIEFAVPDDPSDDDFKYIANDDELFGDCYRTFKDIVSSLLL